MVATLQDLPSLAHPATPDTLVGTAYAALRRDIIEGTLAPSSRLRVEHLKNDYAVGASTLREALSLLVSDGLVVAHSQRGFHVAPMSLADFRDITRTRILLECDALRHSIEHGDDLWESRVLASYHRLSRAEQRLQGDQGFEDWEARNREFHQALISACESRWKHHFLGILYRQAERYRRLSITHRPIPRDLSGEHQRIHDATLARNADLACELLARHIQTTLEAIEHLPAELLERPR